MGLLDKLDSANGGTELNGGITTNSSKPTFGNSLSKAQSIRHKEYSLNGEPHINGVLVKDYFPMVSKGFGLKPLPSQLDGILNGQDPSGPLFDYTNNIPMGNSFVNGTYKNSAPAEGLANI